MLVWSPLDFSHLDLPMSAIDVLRDRVTDRVHSVLSSWLGTEYMLGQQARGYGVDCIRYVCAVVDELYRRARVPIERMPSDTDMHDPPGARRVLRQILGYYPAHVEVLDSGVVQPGDVIITAKPGCGPGHSIIVGADPDVFYHAIEPCVQGVARQEVSADGPCPKFTPYRVYRMTDKEKWL